VSEVVPSLPNMSVGESNFSVPGDGYTTASASLAPSSYSQPLEYVTARMIEKSREQGWSELKDSEAQVAGSPHGHDNLAIWEELKRWDPRVITDYWNVRLKLGRLIAEGGQAQVFEASMHGIDKYAAKVYKMEGFSLADLQHQWPVATKEPQSRWAEEKRFVLGGVAFGEFLANCSEIKCGTFLWDGRFAFVMLRYWGDLRTLVDLKLGRQLNGPPFSHYVTEDHA
jgi:hypothetical protein